MKLITCSLALNPFACLFYPFIPMSTMSVCQCIVALAVMRNLIQYTCQNIQIYPQIIGQIMPLCVFKNWPRSIDNFIVATKFFLSVSLLPTQIIVSHRSMKIKPIPLAFVFIISRGL